MARHEHPTLEEFKFKINAYTRDTIPMRILAGYLADLAIVLGEETSVHLERVEDGCTMPIMRVEHEAVPKINERIHLVKESEGPSDAMAAFERLNERLRRDNADGYIIAPDDSNVLAFPGNRTEPPLEYGPFWQVGALDGIPIKIGGIKDSVPVHLEGRDKEEYICTAKRSIAKQIALHLFTSFIRVEGKGKWTRLGNGEWKLETFTILDFAPVGNATIEEDLQSLRSVPGKWKELDDPIGILDAIRHDKIQ